MITPTCMLPGADLITLWPGFSLGPDQTSVFGVTWLEEERPVGKEKEQEEIEREKRGEKKNEEREEVSMREDGQ